MSVISKRIFNTSSLTRYTAFEMLCEKLKKNYTAVLNTIRTSSSMALLWTSHFELHCSYVIAGRNENKDKWFARAGHK